MKQSKKQDPAVIIPIILEEIVNKHKINIQNVIENESKGPIEQIKAYDKYNQPLSKQAEEEVDLFLKEEHSFGDYEKEVKKYNRLIDEIQYKSRKIIRVGMFELHCDELIKTLSKRAENCMNKLLEKMSKDHFEINKHHNTNYGHNNLRLNKCVCPAYGE